ncbi:MAG: transcriptional regulator [Gammaproteobacteria bacterium]|jgi:hypothetical protein
MLIVGPLRVSVVEPTDGLGRELHLTFTDTFQALPLAEQGTTLRTYITNLQGMIDEREEDSTERQGMLTILQIAEQLLPHVAAGDLALEETIVVEVQPEFSFQGGLAGLRLN